jgi:homoserine O-acetyltransferase
MSEETAKMAETKLGAIGDLPLEGGGVLRDAALAYGTLSADRRNAILLTHGYTSSHLFAESGPGVAEGSWGGLVGPGRAIDTDRFFVVASNMLGSSFGSTGPRSPDPATGRAYGPDFPPITLLDIVTAQRRLLDRLGVRGLIAVAGPSYGGFQAFTWGIAFPDFVRDLVPVVTAPRPPGTDIDALARRLAGDAAWNGGRYEAGGMLATMTALREEMLRRYGLETHLAARLPDPDERAAEITRQARAWAEVFDAHSLLVLARAANAFDATPGLADLQARVLYVLSRSDSLFPPRLAPGVMAAMEAGGVDARYVEIDSPYGHLASGIDSAKWAPQLAAFLAGLD